MSELIVPQEIEQALYREEERDLLIKIEDNLVNFIQNPELGNLFSL